MKVLEEVIARNAPQWSDEQRQAMRHAAGHYLEGNETDSLIEFVRAIAPPQHPLDPSASWVVFSTWLINRAARFGKRLRPPGNLGPPANPTDPFGLGQVQARPAPRQVTLGYMAPPFHASAPKPAPKPALAPAPAPIPSERPKVQSMPPRGAPWHPAMDRPRDCSAPDG